MPEAARPRVYSIAAGQSFVDALARHLVGTPPERLARTRLFLPNRRSVRALTQALIRHAPGQALLMPRMAALGDIDEDEGSDGFAETLDPDVPPAIPPVERRLLLTEAVRGWLVRQGRDEAPLAEALRLADALGRTLDQLTTEGLSPSDVRAALPPELAGHWTQALDFLNLVLVDWPQTLARRQQIDAADRRARLTLALARRWAESPPPWPAIAAGSTGSVPATAALLRTIARLPEGCVVLPGLDTAMDAPLDAEVWDALPEQHPQYGLKQLLDRLEVARGEVDPWPDSAPATPRDVFVQRAMLPAFATARWRDQAPPALDGLRTLEAATEEEEALAIALALRETLETPGRTAALVTPDPVLARRVIAVMRRFAVEIDSSAGQPLALAPPAVFLRLLAEAQADGFAPKPLLALLKHPLCAIGGDRARTRRLAHALDLALRGVRPPAGLPAIAALIARACPAEAASWATFARAFPTMRADSLDALLRQHLDAAQKLADPEQLWAGEAGRMLSLLLDTVLSAAAGLRAVEPLDYPAAFAALLDGAVVRPTFGRHPRLSILGPIEARLSRADLMILGGLNEGVWPQTIRPDPWLSPGMRRALGLPSDQRRIGQAAHDFAQAVGGDGAVLLTRAERNAEGATVPSRFWLRLAAAAGGALPTDDRLLALARALDQPERVTPAEPPLPCPPRAMRPQVISVTQVEKLATDPYAFYAAKILKLQELEPVDADPNPTQRGTAIHKAFELWLNNHPPALWTAQTLEALLQGELRALGAEPLYLALQRPRLQRIAAFAAEALRREQDMWTPSRFEVSGQTEIDGVILKGKADRIDVDATGAWRIVDYKTGQPPNFDQRQYGYAPQLPLLALIAQRGGFSADKTPARVAALAYWRLSGSRTAPGAISDPTLHNKKTELPLDAWVPKTEERLRQAIAHFLKGDAPFPCKVKPDYAQGHEYDHLARLGEWRR